MTKGVRLVAQLDTSCQYMISRQVTIPFPALGNAKRTYDPSATPRGQRHQVCFGARCGR